MGIIDDLKSRYKKHKEKRFLETHGCKTWQEYARRYDNDVGPMARYAHTFYHGYPYVFPIEYVGNPHSYLDLTENIADWCEQNCQGKWRDDWHRGFWNHLGNFELNGIGGTDLRFFAFKEESDYAWFMLRWS